jgi:hypothetical protein
MARRDLIIARILEKCFDTFQEKVRSTEVFCPFTFFTLHFHIIIFFYICCRFQYAELPPAMQHTALLFPY